MGSGDIDGSGFADFGNDNNLDEATNVPSNISTEAMRHSALASPAFAIGFQHLSIPDDDGRPIEIGIWYPSNSQPTEISEGLIHQNAALNGEVKGNDLPTVIFSHGSAGWYADRSETAIAFAQAGIVAVSLTYPGDNYKDSSDRAMRQLTSRPVVTSKVLDYVLGVGMVVTI